MYVCDSFHCKIYVATQLSIHSTILCFSKTLFSIFSFLFFCYWSSLFTKRIWNYIYEKKKKILKKKKMRKKFVFFFLLCKCCQQQKHSFMHGFKLSCQTSASYAKCMLSSTVYFFRCSFLFCITRHSLNSFFFIKIMQKEKKKFFFSASKIYRKQDDRIEKKRKKSSYTPYI